MCPYAENSVSTALNDMVFCKRVGKNVNMWEEYCKYDRETEYCPYLGGDDRNRKKKQEKPDNGNEESAGSPGGTISGAIDTFISKFVIIALIAGLVIGIGLYAFRAGREKLLDCGFLKSKIHYQLAGNGFNDRINDYSFRIRSRKSGEQIIKSFSKQGSVSLKLARGEYDFFIVQKDKQQTRISSLYVDGLTDYEAQDDPSVLSLACVMVSFTDASGNAFSAQDISFSAHGANDAAFTSLDGNKGILLLRLTGGEITLAFFTPTHKSADISIELLSSDYRHLSVTMQER